MLCAYFLWNYCSTISLFSAAYYRNSLGNYKGGAGIRIDLAPVLRLRAFDMAFVEPAVFASSSIMFRNAILELTYCGSKGYCSAGS